MTDKFVNPMKKREADEDDELLRQQEEFFKSNQPSSVKLINAKGSVDSEENTGPNIGKVKSQFVSSKQSCTKRNETEISTSSSGEMINPTIREKIEKPLQKELVDYTKLFNLPKVIPRSVCGDIVERKCTLEELRKMKFEIPHYKTGFAPMIKITDKEWLTKKRAKGMPCIYEEHLLKLGLLKESLKVKVLEQIKNATRNAEEEANVLENSSSCNTEKQANVSDNSSSCNTKKEANVLENSSSCNTEKQANVSDNSSCCNTKKEANILENSFSCNTEKKVNVSENQLASDIHKENLEKLAKMNESEILKEKKRLEETLDPKLIEFLKHKKFKEKSLEEISNNKKIKLSSNDNDARIDLKTDELDIPDLPKNILDESKQKGWLHMNTPEPEKLKWMESLPDKMKTKPILNTHYNARFDFNGLLLPYRDDKNHKIDGGLYHHGEEPERPGYSLQELLHLSRSSNQQQRCIAITTMANIIEKTRKGWYDKVLNPSLLIALSRKNILLLLRFALDDSSVAVITVALQALKAFLVSEADEVCLDRLYEFEGHMQPTLMPQLEEKDTSNLKDHELAQLDAVATLLRSDILLRIRYILSEIHPPPIGVTCALEILIRLARHSHTTSLTISSTPHLLDTIIHNFMPLSINELAAMDVINNVYGTPVIAAVKLCRILVMYGKRSVAEKLDNFKVIQAILTYMSSSTNKKDGINLSIESLRLWQSLLYYNVGLDSISGAQLIFISQLQLLLSNHNIQNTSELECEYATTLIIVASQEKTLKSMLSTLLTKWSSQLSSLSNVTWGVMKLIATTLSVVDEISAFKTTWLSNQHIFSTLRSNSNLLCDNNLATERELSCLPNLGALLENGKLQPILSVNSCIPFLATVMEIFCKYSCTAEIRSIFEHPSFHKYIQYLETADWNLERSWYSRIELRFLTAIVKASSMLGNTINNQIVYITWKIAIKLISVLPADTTDHVKELLQIALSKKKINLEIITNDLAKLDLTSTTNEIKTGLSSNMVLYEKYIIRNGDWNQAAMPRDWLFLPLVEVYTKCKKNMQLQQEDKDSILMVLRLMLILPELMEQLSPNLRFSRIILVYLCNSVYLNEDVSALLLKVVSDLLQRHHAELNFNVEIPGLNSFTDLFTALCEEFYASSYGNDNFAMTLLVPLAQRHDVHYRKMLWSEHAMTLRYLKLSQKQLILPLREYLYPEEEDISLIKNYITTLVQRVITETSCPIPYIIALHHSAMFLKRSNKTAVEMRTQMKKLQDKDIANKLLHYEPPFL